MSYLHWSRVTLDDGHAAAYARPPDHPLNGIHASVLPLRDGGVLRVHNGPLPMLAAQPGGTQEDARRQLDRLADRLAATPTALLRLAPDRADSDWRWTLSDDAVVAWVRTVDGQQLRVRPDPDPDSDQCQVDVGGVALPLQQGGQESVRAWLDSLMRPPPPPWLRWYADTLSEVVHQAIETGESAATFLTRQAPLLSLLQVARAAGLLGRSDEQLRAAVEAWLAGQVLVLCVDNAAVLVGAELGDAAVWQQRRERQARDRAQWQAAVTDEYAAQGMATLLRALDALDSLSPPLH
ncbi:hypothetical protein MNR01_05970 [Lysobacter sp. S4-A87]|uniref:hypothetical protein n=1 Tax=Lysobacter sp. S4-A87 TaxID=2925843 RepID=UPI001F532B50|nr:hypothetical protein [Lysobacter sp. S4-A87]UNK50551.1 hypothetical protein MNR01_05970 [Lysobacter sp. S4-A87]